MTNEELQKVYWAFLQTKTYSEGVADIIIGKNKDDTEYVNWMKSCIGKWEESERILFNAMLQIKTKPQE